MSKSDKAKTNKEHVEWLADNYEWSCFEEQPQAFLIRYEKVVCNRPSIINVWLSKMTIAIVYNGKQHFIKKVSLTKLEEIFINPLKFI